MVVTCEASITLASRQQAETGDLILSHWLEGQPGALEGQASARRSRWPTVRQTDSGWPGTVSNRAEPSSLISFTSQRGNATADLPWWSCSHRQIMSLLDSTNRICFGREFTWSAISAQQPNQPL